MSRLHADFPLLKHLEHFLPEFPFLQSDLVLYPCAQTLWHLCAALCLEFREAGERRCPRVGVRDRENDSLLVWSFAFQSLSSIAFAPPASRLFSCSPVLWQIAHTHPTFALMTVCGFASSGPFSLTDSPQRKGERLELEGGGEGALGSPEQKSASSPPETPDPFRRSISTEMWLIKIPTHTPAFSKTLAVAALFSFTGSGSICRGWWGLSFDHRFSFWAHC